ncbi:MAG: glycosyltransferase family 2 protein [Actinomycetota bacterium]|jgi:cellulose synthase/poly-beta-1,6-N-acetylglucosamine synthase-like glycosyltransferase|nr:glycosyltransferase family 2 protein [Actinomycetota bacterium]
MKNAPTLRQVALDDSDPIEAEIFDQVRSIWYDRPPSPYLVIIPAYNEAESLGYVASRLPKSIGGAKPAVLVVDDGSTDDTLAVAKDLGLNAVRSPVNRGQGASLRSGYLIAIRYGFKAVAIVDADGQWDPADLTSVMAPVIHGEAEISQGSRSLGETQVGDKLRDMGVVFFAKLISFVTRTSITDTSSGIRAMCVSLLEHVRLEQPQYQSSELLISALFAGGRLAEVPVVMKPRFAGATKKGRNFRYALSYSRAVVTTSLREMLLKRETRREQARAKVARAA